MGLNEVIFELGGQDVTLGRLALSLLVWAAWTALTLVAAARSSRRLLWPGTSGGLTVGILLNAFRVKMVLIGLIVALAIVGVRVLPLVYVLLAIGAVAAVSFRSTSEQIWAGLLILWERPFSLGERILVGEYEGEVERVGLRATTLRSEERMSIHVPNSYLTRHAIHNRSKTEGGFGLRIPVEVMAHCDSGEVISALRKAAERNNRVRSSPSPKAFMMSFTARGAQYELRAWVDAYSDGLWARNELCRAIQSEFQRAGIQLVSEKSGARPASTGAFNRPRPTPERDHDSSRNRDRDREREAPRESRPERTRTERDYDPMRSRDRDQEASREERGERPREERSGRSRSDRPSRDRHSSNRSEGSSRGRGRRSESMVPAASESMGPAAMHDVAPVAMDTVGPAAMEDAPMELEAPMAMESETYSSEPQVMHSQPMASATAEPEAPREEFFGGHVEMQSTAEEMPPAAEEMATSEPPAPTFGRSKRRVPRR